MRVALALVLAAACGSHHASGPLAQIYVFAGPTDGAANATVIAHRADGEPIDSVQADAVGYAELAVEDGALVTAVFPGDVDPLSPSVWLVTAPAPIAGGELDIHGPPPTPGPASVAGVLEIMPGQDLGADMYEIDLGCTITQVATMPTSLDVNSHCLGSDTNLDVLVRGFSGTQVLGFAATRVSLETGAATFAPAQWTTTPAAVPIALADVSPQLDWVLVADGLSFAPQTIAGTAPLWTGLAVDAATVHATIGTAAAAQITTLSIAGVPTSIAFGASDFLPPIEPSLALDPSHGLALSWAGAATGADAVNVHLEWDVAGAHHIAWDVVMPPETTGAALPMLTGTDIGTLIGPPDATPEAILRYVTAATPAGWDALVANGLYVENPSGTSTIASPPASGELRATQAVGYAPN